MTTRHFQIFDQQTGYRLHNICFDHEQPAVIIRHIDSNEEVHCIHLEEGQPIYLKSNNMELRVLREEPPRASDEYEVKIELTVATPGTNIFMEKDVHDCDFQEKLYLVGESDIRIGRESRVPLDKGIRITYVQDDETGEGLLRIEGYA